MKTKHFLLSLLALLVSVNASADDAEIDGIYYNFSGSETIVTSGEYSGSVVIPESVTYEGTTYSVTSIGDNAFSWCTGLTSVTIPNSVTSIGERAFVGCSGLTSVTIGNGVTSIGGYAFYECKSLTSITIPGSVTSIGDFAFYECSGLTSVIIGNGVTSIGNYAFRGCSSLTSVTIPNSVTSIGSQAFYNCSGLTSVTIPNSVTSIGEYAFSGCSGLTSITIPGSVTSIGDFAFYECSGLTSVTIPNSVTSIGECAFSKCSSLTYVTIPESVTSIGSNAFMGCSGLTSVTIPNSVTSIESGAFDGTVWYDNQPDGLVYAGKVAYKYKGTMPEGTEIVIKEGTLGIVDWAFAYCSGLTSVTIPGSVTSIGNDAFYDCIGLTSVTIGNGVTSIGSYAFSGCSGLTDVWCYAENVPNTKSYAFYDSPISSATLHVPAGSVEAYRSTAPWSGFGTIVAITPSEYVINDETASLSITAEESGKNVTFTHDFTGDWEALYLPFAIKYDDIKADFDLAEIDGVVQNDENYDGTPDITVLSIMGFREQMTEPNTPYLIRAKNAGEQTITFDDVTIYPTEEASIDCASTSTKYVFTGTYSTMSASSLASKYVVEDGELVKGTSKLAPCRWYMTATSRNGAPLSLPGKIRIMEVEDVITGVETLSGSPEEGQVYNLSGQRLSKPTKGVNIINGKKVLRK